MIALPRALRIAALASALTACSTGSARPSPPAAPAAASEPAASSKAPALRLGEPVSGSPIALSVVAKNPRAYEGKPFVTSGVVTSVCQSMGCWMEIRDEASDAHIRMHGHAFFVPKSASGRHARALATVVPAEDAKECDESPAKGGAPSALAKVELDATGVELD